MRNQVYHEQENELKRLEFTGFQKERTNEMLMYNNQIASYQRELEADETQSIRLQQESDTSLRATTQKTLALGQIVLAIGNLLQRCTCGIHGQVLKHMEASQVPVPGPVQSTSTERGSASPSGTSGGNSKEMQMSGTMSSGDSIQRGRKAVSDLDVVASYMVDFTAIVQARVDAQRAFKKATAGGTGAGTGTGTGVGTSSTSVVNASLAIGGTSSQMDTASSSSKS
jgi:hypothetical protein